MWIKNTTCPCEWASESYAEYEDGHAFCFSCNKYFGEGMPREKPQKGDVEFLQGDYSDLSKRCLYEKTCRRFGYFLADYEGKRVQVANFYDRKGDLVGQKVRLPNKEFRVIGDVSGKLFGTATLRTSGKRVVVTEGEIDAMSYAEAAGDWPVVSIPNGAQSARKALEQNIDLLEAYDEIVIAFDNDEPGQKAAKQCAMLFSPGKAKLAALDPAYKDFNEALQAGNSKAIQQAVWNAKEYRPDGVVAGSEVWDALVNRPPVVRYEYPWPCFNKLTRGLRKGELVTITAGTGIGKSAVCREILYDLLMRQKATVGGVFLEENISKTALGIISIHVNEPIHLDPYNIEMGPLKPAFDATLGSGRLFLYDHFGSMDIDNLLSKVRYLIKACGCDFVIIDHLSIVISGLQIEDERKAIDVAMTKLRTLVEETGAGVIIVSHLKRPSGDQGHENGLDPQLSHLRGSHAIPQLSDIVIGLSRDQQSEDARDLTKVLVLKNRFSGETGYAGTLKYDPTTGRLSEAVSFETASSDGIKTEEEF